MDKGLARKLLLAVKVDPTLPIDTAFHPSLAGFSEDALRTTLEYLTRAGQLSYVSCDRFHHVLTDKGKKLLANGTPFRLWSEAFAHKTVITKRELEVCVLLVLLYYARNKL
jgi:hypothetical protein